MTPDESVLVQLARMEAAVSVLVTMTLTAHYAYTS